MKFCKNLQRVATLFDPSWAPFWINYKRLKVLATQLTGHLRAPSNPNLSLIHQPCANHSVSSFSFIFLCQSEQKLLKALPMLETEADSLLQCQRAFSAVFGGGRDPSSLGNVAGGDEADERRPDAASEYHCTTITAKPSSTNSDLPTRSASLAMSPREVIFFKLLHAELRKAMHFFELAEKELGIREERIRDGIRIEQERQVGMISRKWIVAARSVHRLFKDLLTLETYAVMAYCSFSKILKKHDKVTGCPTRVAYMTSFVEKANFASYPRLLEMLHRCRRMDDEISGHIFQDVSDHLTEDERLFVDAVQQISDEATRTTARYGAPAFATRARQVLWKPTITTVPRDMSVLTRPPSSGKATPNTITPERRSKRVNLFVEQNGADDNEKERKRSR